MITLYTEYMQYVANKCSDCSIRVYAVTALLEYHQVKYTTTFT